MREQLAWPLVERGVRAWLVAQLPAGVEVLTETGADVPDEYVVLTRAGGSGDATDRRVWIEMVVCTRTRGRLWEVVRLVETAMGLLAANGLPGGMYVDEVVADFDWADDPLPSQDVRRATSQYALTIRPTRA